MTLHPGIAKFLATLPAPPEGPLDPVAMRAADEAHVASRPGSCCRSPRAGRRRRSSPAGPDGEAEGRVSVPGGTLRSKGICERTSR